jgi:hypothetical protein
MHVGRILIVGAGLAVGVVIGFIAGILLGLIPINF